MLAQFRPLINRYAKPYLVLVCLLWLAMFFVRWDTMVLGYNLYFLVMQKGFLILGILTILMGAISKRWGSSYLAYSFVVRFGSIFLLSLASCPYLAINIIRLELDQLLS